MITAEALANRSSWGGPLTMDNIELVYNWMREWLDGHRFVQINMTGTPCPAEGYGHYEYPGGFGPDVTADIAFEKCELGFEIHQAEGREGMASASIRWVTGRSICWADVTDRVPDTAAARKIEHEAPNGRSYWVTTASFDWRKGLTFETHSGAGNRCVTIIQRQEKPERLAEWEG